MDDANNVIHIYVFVFVSLTIICLLVNFGINNWTIIVSLCLLVIGVAIFLAYRYYESSVINTKITNRIRDKGLIELQYDYGQDSQSIGNKFRITFNPGTFRDVWWTFMCSDRNTLRALLVGLPETGVNLPDNITYDILWYLCICQIPGRMNFSTKDVKHIIMSNNSQLLSYLGQGYLGAKDTASLIFTVLTGYIVPEVEYSLERYQQIKNYAPQTIHNLVFTNGNMIDEDNRSYKLSGPYLYLSTLQPALVETLMDQVDKENHQELIEKLGIGPINNFSTMSNQQISTYLRAEISLYNNIFARPTNTELPPPLINLSRQEIMHILSFYTNVELIEAYEPRAKWHSRAELLLLICDDLLTPAKWSIRSTSHCTNEDSINIITGDIHKDINKEDRDDPTLSFGKHKNYRCYQVSELEASFDIQDGIFLFSVPDWRPSEIDVITGNPLPKEFNLDSIKQLHKLLLDEQVNYNVGNLIAKIDVGFELMKSAKGKMQQLKRQLEEFSYDQRQIVELYLGWMFTYSMWMRFWKGPGTPWPMNKVNVSNRSLRNAAQRSSPEERDEHIFIQDGVRTAIIEMYEQDEQLKNFLEELPTIYYDFDTLEMSCATHNIKDILDKIAIGDYCMGFGSDTVLKTSYCYITSLLDYPEGKSFDEYISRILPIVFDLEYSYIMRQLDREHFGIRSKVLNNRLSATSQPIPLLIPFSTSCYQNNVHIE